MRERSVSETRRGLLAQRRKSSIDAHPTLAKKAVF
jgi:hypothetical protein